MNNQLKEIGYNAKKTLGGLQKLGSSKKNDALLQVARGLLTDTDEIIKANENDMAHGRENHMPQGLLDRLQLTPERISQMSEGLEQIASLEDPIGEVLSMKTRPNGLRIGKKRVPIGVVGIIYEARPNVTADAFGLCFKTGNAVILKGGSDALNSNIAIVKSIQASLKKLDIDKNVISLITDTDREVTKEFMQMNEYLDVLIPRGGAGLIQAVVKNATVPVIETGTGNCHIYVDETADLSMAVDIIENAKTQRIGVCNACESLVLHEKIATQILPMIKQRLQAHSVEMRVDERGLKICPDLIKATDEDWGTEYLDYIISVKIVSGIDEAIAHINKYNTGHSEAIITTDYNHAEQFLDEIDAACVYVNASTRFTDGFEFGFGAEIGISTQKLHARGPMGLEALTSTKYIIYGNGQIRP
ncbi:MAG: glutamate-5-semialdehyde dehydrogenase [Lachnospiraceae bacterium]|nr:glutamate-5-semialdehyde dehydrogenase [Lachnospiraceae bacterium]MDD6193247.1 glutamate-5-semialdehyde dehydrogenase [Lachnospiraceae bacterium]MDY4794201.1 glutamate-5-semialdehyde dehydrogenase [Pararoseburia sp.]